MNTNINQGMHKINIEDPFTYNTETKELFASGPEYQPYPGGLGKFYYDRIKELANENEDIIANIDAETGDTQTFKELFESSVKLAQYLQNIGVKPGDIIAMCSYNTIDAAIVLVAVHFIGALLASTDPILSLEDTKYLLNMIKPVVVFVSEGSEHLIQESIRSIKITAKIITFARSHSDEHDVLEEILHYNLESSNEFEPFFVDNLNDTSSILFSSGTTGMPKGICLSHHYFLSFMGGCKTMNLKLVLLNYASLYWISSVYNMNISIWFASARLLCKSFNKETHWRLVEKYQVTNLLLSNTYCIEALKYLDEDVNLSKLNIISVAGGPIPDKEMANYCAKLPKTKIGYVYALTEGGLVSQFEKGDKFGSCGKPSLLNQTIKIVDPDTQENLPLNKVGEIRIKRMYQMAGYYKIDSGDAWDEEGFLKTGDLGYLDDDFHLYIVDRIKEMFKFRSWHVVPAKSETVLSSHPHVLYAIVVGKPSYDEDENHAMAIVCLHDGAKANAEEIERFANEQLDDINKIRSGVKIVDKKIITFTPTGKINRRMLKDMFIQRKS